jgi:hypothetical protein
MRQSRTSRTRHDFTHVRGPARVIPCNPPRVLIIRGFKQLGGFLSSDNGSGGEHLRRLAGFGETIGDFGFDGVHEKAATDGAAGCHGCFEAFDLDHGITNGGAGVEDDVGEVLELFAVAVAAGAGLAVRGADDGGDLDAALLKLLGHLDGDDVAAAAGDDEGAVAGHGGRSCAGCGSRSR